MKPQKFLVALLATVALALASTAADVATAAPASAAVPVVGIGKLEVSVATTPPSVVTATNEGSTPVGYFAIAGQNLSTTVTITFTSTDPSNTQWNQLYLIAKASNNVIINGPVTGPTMTWTGAKFYSQGTSSFTATLGLANPADPSPPVQYAGSRREFVASISAEYAPPVAGTVSISGDPTVGQTLTATVAGWENTNTYAYQWYRNNVPIASATGKNYVPTAADAGQNLRVSVEGTGPGGTDTAWSAPVQVSGTVTTYTGATVAAVGDPFALSAAVTNQGEPVTEGSVEFWWDDGTRTSLGVAPVVDGVAATSIAFPAGWTPTSRIVASYVGTSANPASESQPAAVDVVTAVTSATPVITGGSSAASAAVAGTTYAVDPGAWGPAGTSLAYEWVVVDGANEDSRGTGDTFTPGIADIGKALKVVATGTFGSLSASRDSAEIPIAAPTATQIRPPGGSWQAQAGDTSELAVTVTSPAGEVGTGIVTLLDSSNNVIGTGAVTAGVAHIDVALPGAVGDLDLHAAYSDATWQFGPSDDDATIEVATVTPGTPVILNGAGAAADGPVESELSVNVGAWSPLGLNYAYEWYVDHGSGLVQVGDDATYTPTLDDLDGDLTVKVTGASGTLTPRTATSAAVPVTLPTTTTITMPDGVLRAPAGTTRSVTVSVGSALGAATAGTVTLFGPTASDVLGTAAVGPDGTAVFDVAFPGAIGGTLHLWAEFGGDGPLLPSATDAVVDLVGPLTPGTGAMDGTQAGKARVGAAVGAVTAGWDPDVTFTYQWLRDGETQVGSDREYLPTQADAGRTLTLIITAHRPGYDPVELAPLSATVLSATLSATGAAPLTMVLTAIVLLATGLVLTRERVSLLAHRAR